ncbi:hypothetical protein BO79DRAFT_143514, partial [Aspergillus costaricaensis CBS 115574]
GQPSRKLLESWYSSVFIINKISNIYKIHLSEDICVYPVFYSEKLYLYNIFNLLPGQIQDAAISIKVNNQIK